jgi:hypothetical protein
MSRPILTLKSSFKAKLDQMAREAEAGATIRFDNEADALAFLKRAPITTRDPQTA